MGGSFNPAHEGHLHVAETALKRLRLDAVWWIVARGNPLKSEHGSYTDRLASARRLTSRPRMHVSDIEAAFGLTYSADTIAALQAAAPSARFVWIMGADNLRNFHQWKDWEGIAARLPLAVIARPGARISKTSPFARKFASARLREADAPALALSPAPAWIYLRARESAASSTA
ncbi:MAG: nicotinate-nucleotide adenylyltransferase, partial [Thermaurantiacus sp.]